METMTANQTAALANEIHECTQTQSWSPTARRARWVDDLIAIRDATTPAERAAAITAADITAAELAEQVARDLMYVGLADAASRAADDTVTDADRDALLDATTPAEVIRWCRSHGVTWDDAVQGHRDGYAVTDSIAVAYATCRDWRGDPDPRWVEVDLLTGEAVVK